MVGAEGLEPTNSREGRFTVSRNCHYAIPPNWSNAHVLPTVSLLSKSSGLAVFLALDKTIGWMKGVLRHPLTGHHVGEFVNTTLAPPHKTKISKYK